MVDPQFCVDRRFGLIASKLAFSAWGPLIVSTSRRDSGATSRRRFLATSGAALAGAAAPNLAAREAQSSPVLLPPYVADVDGDGQLGPLDQEVVRTALFAQRGFDLVPRPGFDQRADVFGRGSVEPLGVDSVAHSIDQHIMSLAPAITRPITIAWHYGWYNTLDRPPGRQTVRLKGGNYRSFDPEVETTFHDLKNEFGVTVDALSWIPKRNNKDNQDNYRRGFFAAPNVGSRYFCLLYESTIALPGLSGRIDLQSDVVQFLIREDFAQMARFFTEVRDASPARIFTLDGRPVVFIFGSHTWGLLPISPGFLAVDAMITSVRQIFKDIYGVAPYLVGEEMFLSASGRFSNDRRRRTVSFDAIYVYHHASNIKRGIDATLQISRSYIDNQLNILRRTYETIEPLRNRYTGQRVLVIPNLAPGFAKPGHPTLQLGRSGYADFMKLLHDLHMTEHLFGAWHDALGSTLLPAPIYIVGSWNEEFEGHCIFPFDFNFSVPEVVQQGFDLSMAVKEVFGWNHYARRDIVGGPPPEPDV